MDRLLRSLQRAADPEVGARAIAALIRACAVDEAQVRLAALLGSDSAKLLTPAEDRDPSTRVLARALHERDPVLPLRAGLAATRVVLPLWERPGGATWASVVARGGCPRPVAPEWFGPDQIEPFATLPGRCLAEAEALLPERYPQARLARSLARLRSALLLARTFPAPRPSERAFRAVHALLVACRSVGGRRIRQSALAIHQVRRALEESGHDPASALGIVQRRVAEVALPPELTPWR